MTQAKAFGDTSGRLLGDAIAHNGEAVRIILELARASRLPIEVRQRLGLAGTHLAASQQNLHEMQRIHDANKGRGRRSKRTAAPAEREGSDGNGLG